MKLLEHITAEEVNKVCKKLNTRDWTTSKGHEVTPEEASAILAELKTGKMRIPLEKLNLNVGYASRRQTWPTITLF